MDGNDHTSFTIESAKLFALWIISQITHGYHETAGNILITLSIGYAIWKWRREFIMDAKESEAKKAKSNRIKSWFYKILK